MSKRKSDGWISQRSDGRWNVGYGGKRTVRATRAAALECLRKLRAKGDKDKAPTLGGTVAACVDWWMRHVFQVGVKPTTFTTYDSCLRGLLSCGGNKTLALGDIQMRALKASDVQNAVRIFAKEKDRADAAKRALLGLSRCCEYYVAEGTLNKNPCEGVAPPEKKKRQLITDNLAYDGDEIQAIISETLRRASNGNYVHKYWYAYLLLINTGMRIGELVYLKWENVDLSARTITISGNRERVKDPESGKFVTIEQDTAKTATSTRVIPINESAMQVFNELVKFRQSTTGHVVLSNKGRPVTVAEVTKPFYRILERSGVEKRKRHGVHSLRHTFATRLIERGVPIKIVSELLGHSSTAITLDIYVHHTPDDFMNAVELLNE